jgi:hypothetical protein
MLDCIHKIALVVRSSTQRFLIKLKVLNRLEQNFFLVLILISESLRCSKSHLIALTGFVSVKIKAITDQLPSKESAHENNLAPRNKKKKLTLNADCTVASRDPTLHY